MTYSSIFVTALGFSSISSIYNSMNYQGMEYLRGLKSMEIFASHFAAISISGCLVKYAANTAGANPIFLAGAAASAIAAIYFTPIYDRGANIINNLKYGEYQRAFMSTPAALASIAALSSIGGLAITHGIGLAMAR